MIKNQNFGNFKMPFKCRVCQSKNLKNILNLGLQPWGNDFIKISENRRSDLYPLNFVICKDCMTSQIDYTIPKEKMFVDAPTCLVLPRRLKIIFKSR